MTPEHDQRFREIVREYLERPGGDYAELLWRGRVSSREGVDPEQWRAEIRAKARADKVRVITYRQDERAFAIVNRDTTQDELDRVFEQAEVLRGLASRARDLAHDLTTWLGHDSESIAFCERCAARLYVRFDPDLPIVDGEALGEVCRGAPDAHPNQQR